MCANHSHQKKLTAEVRRDVLAQLDRGVSGLAIRSQFHLTAWDMRRIIEGPKHGKAKGLAKREVNKEANDLRSRLREKSVVAVEDGLKKNEDFKRATIGVKVLEGLGDLHRPSEIPPEIPKERPALFNLPPGAQVAVTVNLNKGEANAAREINGQAVDPAVP